MFVLKILRPSRSDTSDGSSKASDTRQIAPVSTADRDRILADVLKQVGSVGAIPAELASVLQVAVVNLIDPELSQLARARRTATGADDSRAFARELGRVLQGLVSQWVGPGQGGAKETGVLALTVPVIDLVGDARALVQDVVETALGWHGEDGARWGSGIAKRIVKRLCEASRLSEEEARQRPRRLKWPKDSDLTGRELVERYLAGTELGELLLAGVTVRVSDRARMENMLIVGGSGAGKSQLLEFLMAHDLARPQADKVGLVVIDSQSDMINRLKRLRCIKDRLLLVDASDVADHPISANLFDLGSSHSGSSSGSEAELARTARLQLVDYVMQGLMGEELSLAQATTIRMLSLLMMSIPGATIRTLRECVEEPRTFASHIDTLPETPREFFKSEFMSKGFGVTRKAISRRIYGVLTNSAFERMFSSPRNKLDLGRAMSEGRVVLVNTSRAVLGEECKVLGRYIIALCVSAALERARIPQEQRRKAFLVIDEAGDYTQGDASIGQLLVQARKFNVGTTLAVQSLAQLGVCLRALAMTNTAVKCASRVSSSDAKALAAEMRTSETFILAQQKTTTEARFATYVGNLTPQAVTWRIPLGTLDREPRMSDAEFAAVLARNRKELCG